MLDVRVHPKLCCEKFYSLRCVMVVSTNWFRRFVPHYGEIKKRGVEAAA